MTANGPIRTVMDLQNAGALLVEDGNHGEYRPRPNEFDTSGVAFIRAANMGSGRVLFDSASKINATAQSRIRKGIGRPGDVLLSHKGTVGKVAFAPLDCEPFVCSPQTTFWRVLDEQVIDRRYLYYHLVSVPFQQQLASYKGETDMADYVSLTVQRTLKLPLPHITIQNAVARILGSLDDKIELNRRMNETLEAMGRTLFQSWFIDFDPVRKKAEGRKLQGIDDIGAMFPKEFEESRLGPVPKGWRVGMLQEVAEIIMGSSPPGETYNETGIGTPLVNGPVEFGDYFTIKRKWTTQPGKLSQPNDLVFCVRGSTTGRRVVADDVYCLGRGVCSIRAKSGAWGYVHRLTEFSLERMLSRVSGSVFPNLNGPDLKEFEVVIPDERLIAEYQRRVEPWLNLIGVKVRESVSLATLREALLPKMLSGEIRVKDAEKIAEADS